jgi:secondary thiamine-phosphate synthase enzyme
MILYCDSLNINHGIGPDIVDITMLLSDTLKASGIMQGMLSAFVVGSTGSLTTIEFEPGVVQDLKEAVNRLAPPDMPYAHELAWHDGNGHSHVQAALLGPSVTIPVRQGMLALGTWQQVVLINHDNGPRERRAEVTVIGT